LAELPPDSTVNQLWELCQTGPQFVVVWFVDIKEAKGSPKFRDSSIEAPV